MNPIAQLIQDYGSEAKLAEALGVSQPAVNKIKDRERVSPQMAKRIEALTSGRFTRWQMRPDIFDAPQAAVPA